MPTQKIDPKVIFASDAPAIDNPPVFSDKTKGWDVSRLNDGRPTIKEMNKVQQDTDLKILWLNENSVTPYDESIDYPDGAVAIKDGSFKQLASGAWVEFLDDFADSTLQTLESNRAQNPNKFTLDQVLFEKMPTSTTGTPSVLFRNGIKQLKLVSANTGGSIIAQWDFDATLFTREFAASIVVEGLTSGSNGLVGIQQVGANGTVIASTYAKTSITAAVSKETYKVNVGMVVANAAKIRLIVNMQTATTREMYVHSPFISDGTNADFIAPIVTPNLTPLTGRVGKLETAFNTVVVGSKNKFNPALAQDAGYRYYVDGSFIAFPNGMSFGKQQVEEGKTYTWWLPNTLATLGTILLCYNTVGTYLGTHVLAGSNPLAPIPPTGVVFSDSNHQVTFTIPVGSGIGYIAINSNLAAHTSGDFTAAINAMQLEEGSIKTAYEPYNPGGGTKLVLKPESLPPITIPDTSAPRNTFTLTTNGVDAYIRTPYNSTLDLVQQVRYGSNTTWSNNVINPWEVRTIPKSTAKDGVIAAFSSGAILASQGDDAAPLNYNGTYIGANHGAYIVHEVTVNAHGKTYADVGSRWTQGANIFTIVRIVDVNKLWLVSQNTGSTYWQFVTTSLNGLALTHSTGATNTASFTPSADTLTQLLSAVNNHTKKIVADGFKELTTAGVYDVESIEFIDSYDIMNPPAILTYLQGRTGTATEQNLSVDSIASEVRVSVTYRYVLNGSCTVSTQLHKKANINFSFAGLVQANPLNYSGKTLIEYANKMKPVTVGGTPYDISATIDATSNTAVISMLKSDWLDATNPPDRMLNLVKNGSNKEFGQVLGYSLTRGATKPSIRQNTTDAGFFNNPTTKKVYPKALVSNLDTVVNAVAYRSLYNPNLLPEATVYTWYEDNGEIFVVLDIHQSASMLKLPLPAMFNGKSAEVIDSYANFTLHSEIVSDGGLLCSIVNSYASVTIRLK
ncbi:MAG: hypothetical protein RSE18_00670 [Acinetobacter sp.]